MPDSWELKNRGLKVTLPRLQILGLFQHAQSRHMSAEEVYRLLFQQGQDVGLATVYRVLAQLHQAGLLKQARLDADRVVYELDDGKHHDHLICITCGQVREFHDDELELRQKHIAQAKGFELVEHAHILYGRCTDSLCEHRRHGDAAQAYEHP